MNNETPLVKTYVIEYTINGRWWEWIVTARDLATAFRMFYKSFEGHANIQIFDVYPAEEHDYFQKDKEDKG